MDKDIEPINGDLENVFNAIRSYASNLAKEDQDISAIMFDQETRLGKAWLHFEAEFYKENQRLRILRD